MNSIVQRGPGRQPAQLMETGWYSALRDAINRRDVAGGQALLDRATAKVQAGDDPRDDAMYHKLCTEWCDMLEDTCKVCGQPISSGTAAGHEPVPYLSRQQGAL